MSLSGWTLEPKGAYHGITTSQNPTGPPDGEVGFKSQVSTCFRVPDDWRAWRIRQNMGLYIIIHIKDGQSRKCTGVRGMMARMALWHMVGSQQGGVIIRYSAVG